MFLWYKGRQIHQYYGKNCVRKACEDNFFFFCALDLENIRIFVVNIWQIRKETPKTKGITRLSLKEQNIGYSGYIVARRWMGQARA